MIRGVGLWAMVVLLAGVSILSGCAEEKGAATGKNGNVLHMTIDADPPTLDSAFALDGNSYNLLNNVMEGLMRLGKGNKPEPAMAENTPEVSADGRTYTFRIRENAEWSDGQPVRAQDFEYAWKRILNPETKSPAVFHLFPIENATAYVQGQISADEVGVKALDDRTLEVRLEESNPHFLELTATAPYLPVRQDKVEESGGKFGREADQGLYNGPFILSDWKHEQLLTLKKNDRYWDKEMVQLEEVRAHIVKKATDALGMYTSDEADVVPLNAVTFEAFRNSAELVTHQRGALVLIMLNTKEPPFNNKNIRKALNLAINRDQLVNELLKNGSRPAGGMVPPAIHSHQGESFRDKTEDYVEFDPAKAKKLLEKGLEEEQLSRMPDIVMSVNDDERRHLALFIQEELKNHLGVDVQISPQPVSQKVAVDAAGQFQMTIVRWIGSYDDPMAFLEIGTSVSPVNFGRWGNQQFDYLVHKAKGNPDPAWRETDLIQAEAVVAEDAGVAPLYYEAQAFIQKPHVKNLFRHPVGPEYSLKWARIEK
ncbi:peptide ABC transporter substrate-binding protein [Desmospora profundinema]|uniref:Oligopeptide transport system substrate-binding protein n=1 Tax=Desmospora profundinema TaxID=1571184 RepID=A0ABU1IQ93_9BACL|nr:peptide ABC transporter substrate-binding protein [Desmospora profundinema]MDR6226898.1 oligopeptide transport system substrate-binding protein [Desmospora profundinema]